MYLENIRLINFKNYKELNISFCSKLNIITGANGSGKTNLLDAIYYLSQGRSALNIIDSQNINNGELFFSVTGSFYKETKKHKVSCHIQKTPKKNLWINKNKVDKVSEFIGNFPVVLATPDDNVIVREGSEIRRSFFDDIFSQLDKIYLNNLIEYTKALRSRNILLKHFGERHYFDLDLLEPYSNLLIEKGKVIYNLRKKYILDFTLFFHEYFYKITENKEHVELSYISSFGEEDFNLQLLKALPKDRILERTTVGIHKDDFVFNLKNFSLKKFGSQGQQKSFLIALKFAHHAIIKKHKNINPILLLDDIFDKLDENRINKLLELILGDNFEQVFITDARGYSLDTFFIDHFPTEKCTYQIRDNQIFKL